MTTDAAADRLAIRIDPASSEPPFAQIRMAIIEAASSGRLVPGSKLPTVRGLAAALGVAAGTVARAYRELEEAGWVETRSRAGTVIAARDGEASPGLVAGAREFAAAARREGLSDDAAIALIRAALDAR